MITGKTSTGFEYKVDPEALEDMEYLDLLVDVQEKPILYPKLIEFVLGTEQKKRLYESVRNDNGRVPVAAVSKVFDEILTQIGENAETKN